MKILVAFIVLNLMTWTAIAGEADVMEVKVSLNQDKSYRFDVTVKHADEGWNHFANKWQILDPNGKVLAERVLHHPHVNEQPFTRSIYSVKIPKGIKSVTVRAGDSVHLFGGLTQDVAL